jgi:apolipoprotein N-acyltransferase
MGFPCFQLGYTQHAYLPLLQMASIGSVTLVSAWVVVVNILLWRSLPGGARGLARVGLVLAFALPWAYGTRVLRAAPKQPGPVVAVVQPNIPGEIKWSGQHQDEILKSFLDLSRQAAAHVPPPTLIIWPETATGSYLRKQVGQAIAVARFAHETNIPVFTGFADFDYGPADQLRNYNAAGLFPPDARLGPVYAKRHLVPFGERMPFQRLVPALGKIELGQAEWTPGAGSVRFPSAAGPFGCLICFESIFPDLARDDVRHGARWLVNITNDEWFGNGAALVQHAAMAPFRAVENHVPLARCANTGMSFLVDAYGRVTQRVPVYQSVVLVSALGAPRPPTGTRAS